MMKGGKRFDEKLSRAHGLFRFRCHFGGVVHFTSSNRIVRFVMPGPIDADQATASGKRRLHDSCHTSRCLRPSCSPLLLLDRFARDDQVRVLRIEMNRGC